MIDKPTAYKCNLLPGIAMVALVLIYTNCSSQVLFYEDFDGAGSYPLGWTLYDEDDGSGTGDYQQDLSQTNSPLPPSSGGNSVWSPIYWSSYKLPSKALTSTSSLLGNIPANDWIVTPPISIDGATHLYWKAMSAGSFPYNDGYEVRISASPIHPDTNQGVIIFSLERESDASFQSHQINLSDHGFINQSVYIAWRNNQTEGNLLLIDDIKILGGAQPYADIRLARPNRNSARIVPLAQKAPLIPAVKIVNSGRGSVSNAQVTLNILDNSLQNIFSYSSNVIGNLGEGMEMSLTSPGSWDPPDTGTYFFEYVAKIDEVDQEAQNDTLIDVFIIGSEFISKENGIAAGSVGMQSGGAVGKEFEVVNPDLLTSISMRIKVDSLSSFGSQITGGVYSLYNDTPIFRIAITEKYTITDTGAYLIDLPISGGAISLDPGKYIFMADLPATIDEPILEYAQMTDESSTDWLTHDYLNWFRVGDLAVNAHFIIRPGFGENHPCVPPKHPVVIAFGPTSASLQWEDVNQAIGYEISGFLSGSDTSEYLSTLRMGQENTSYHINGLCEDESYEWRVRSLCAISGNNSYSEYTTVKTFQTKKCNAPDSIHTAGITQDAATLSWSTVDDAIGYLITGQVQGGSLVSMVVPGTHVSSLDVESLPAASEFFWQVQSVCAIETPCTGGLPLLSDPINASFATVSSSPKFDSVSLLSRSFDENLTVYPNPAAHEFHFVFQSLCSVGERIDLDIFNMEGRHFFSKSYHLSSGIPRRITTNRFKNGIYLLTFKGKNGVAVRRLAVSN